MLPIRQSPWTTTGSRALGRQPRVLHPVEAELDRRVRLAHRVELLVEARHLVARLEERQPRRRDRVDLRQLLGQLDVEARRRALDDPAADRLAVDPLHHERLAAFDLAQVGDRLGHLDARLVRGAKHLELVLERERRLVDDAAGGAADQQLASVRVDRPGLLRRAAGEQHGTLDRSVERRPRTPPSQQQLGHHAERLLLARLDQRASRSRPRAMPPAAPRSAPSGRRARSRRRARRARSSPPRPSSRRGRAPGSSPPPPRSRSAG